MNFTSRYIARYYYLICTRFCCLLIGIRCLSCIHCTTTSSAASWLTWLSWRPISFWCSSCKPKSTSRTAWTCTQLLFTISRSACSDFGAWSYVMTMQRASPASSPAAQLSRRKNGWFLISWSGSWFAHAFWSLSGTALSWLRRLWHLTIAVLIESNGCPGWKNSSKKILGPLIKSRMVKAARAPYAWRIFPTAKTSS